MKIVLKTAEPKEIFVYMERFPFPYRYGVGPAVWEKSWLHDVDGNGRPLFRSLISTGAYLHDRLVGFIQFGCTAFGFEDRGEITDRVSYPVIRSFYFDEGQPEAGTALLQEALGVFSETPGRIFAFFHYFGMSCWARHGKLFERYGYIHDLLTRSGFAVEHENVFYSSVLGSAADSAIQLRWHKMTSGGQRYCDFVRENVIAGGCEVHFLEQEDAAYLRWIFVESDLRGKGTGTECMSPLKSGLFRMGIKRLDTDTALTNGAAQHFYEKNYFRREGLSRSYYLDYEIGN